MNPIPLYEQTGTTGNSNIEEICAIIPKVPFIVFPRTKKIVMKEIT